MATKLDILQVDELFVAGQRVTGGATPVAPPAPGARPAVLDSEAATVKALVADFNALLGALRATGVLAEE